MDIFQSVGNTALCYEFGLTMCSPTVQAFRRYAFSQYLFQFVLLRRRADDRTARNETKSIALMQVLHGRRPGSRAVLI